MAHSLAPLVFACLPTPQPQLLRFSYPHRLPIFAGHIARRSHFEYTASGRAIIDSPFVPHTYSMAPSQIIGNVVLVLVPYLFPSILELTSGLPVLHYKGMGDIHGEEDTNSRKDNIRGPTIQDRMSSLACTVFCACCALVQPF